MQRESKKEMVSNIITWFRMWHDMAYHSYRKSPKPTGPEYRDLQKIEKMIASFERFNSISIPVTFEIETRD